MVSIKKLLIGWEWTVGRCHSYNMYTRRREDLFGIFDWVCIDKDANIIFLQETSGGNGSNRVKKIENSGILGPMFAYTRDHRRVEVWDYVGKQKKYKRAIWNRYIYNPENKKWDICKVDTAGTTLEVKVI